MKIGLSKRKHLPVLKLNCVNYSFPLWQYRKARMVEKTGLRLDSEATSCLIKDLPKGYYLPPFSLTDLTVLDIGACCGETAWYFLKHGANKVVCIECDRARVKIIEENRRNLNLNIEIVPEPFKPEHLSIPHDFIKCDIEGGEVELLPYANILKPCVVEVHNRWIKEQFEQNGFHIMNESSSGSLFLMANYSL